MFDPACLRLGTRRDQLGSLYIQLRHVTQARDDLIHETRVPEENPDGIDQGVYIPTDPNRDIR